jgi:hypothetical protein
MLNGMHVCLMLFCGVGARVHVAWHGACPIPCIRMRPHAGPLSFPLSSFATSRDICNGFLVAEIFSRYYKHDIQMHSYENGSNTFQKKDNWAQLTKFWAKMSIPIPAQLVEDTLNCKTGAASSMIETIYTILTGKTYVFALQSAGV